MGRPRRHDEDTATALLAEAERVVEAEGLEALTVRRVADAVGVTTRAVYSVFGAKDGLVVALGRQAFDQLGERVAALPETADPAADLVDAGLVFRRFAVERPAVYSIVVQRRLPRPELARGFKGAAAEALAVLQARVERLNAVGGLGERSIRDAVTEFHALCEGLAAIELRAILPAGDEERIWRDALTALVRGFALPH